jgi:competence protein ComEC
VCLRVDLLSFSVGPMKSLPKIAFLLLGCLLTVKLDAGLVDHRLDIYWIDVEGGGATLVVTPSGQSVLIDAGSFGMRDAARIHDTATTVVGLSKIDFYILTHFHFDHFGGIAPLASLMPIGQVYDRGIPRHDPDYSPTDGLYYSMIEPYRHFKADGRNLVTPTIVLPLQQTNGGPQLTLRCIASGGNFVDASPDATLNPIANENSHHDLAASENDMSSAWLLSFGPFRFWDGGDLTWNKEGEVVTPLNRVGQVDVYQVDHHGLNFSNNPVLIHSLAPTVSVMNNGSTKGTASTTMAALRSSPGLQAMYQVHKNLRPEDPQDNTSDDCIANFSSDPNHPDANYIKLSVDPTGVSYTISIPASGYSRIFQTRLVKP